MVEFQENSVKEIDSEIGLNDLNFVETQELGDWTETRNPIIWSLKLNCKSPSALLGVDNALW